MRLGRVATHDGVAFVSLEGDGVVPSLAKEISDHPFGNPKFTGRVWKTDDVRFLSPILASKVVCIGKNYAAHIQEMGELVSDDPVMFIKPSTSIVGPYAPVIMPAQSDRVDFEGELAIVIGKPCKNVAEKNARDVILGYTIANDVTARDLQRKDGQWTRGKGFDTFCPLGPWIDTVFDPSDVSITTSVEGKVRQASRTGLMIHSIGFIVEWVSSVMTLLPGDVILTGTPEGVGPVSEGEQVSVTVEGLGTLTNPFIRKNVSL